MHSYKKHSLAGLGVTNLKLSDFPKKNLLGYWAVLLQQQKVGYSFRCTQNSFKTSNKSDNGWK